MRTVSLAEEVALLAYDDDGRPLTQGMSLDAGLAGALLAELALAGRIGLDGQEIAVRDAAPTGDPTADAALARISTARRPRKTQDWLRALADDARPAVLDRLVDASILRRQEDRVLWVFPRTRYPAPHGQQPPAETDTRQRIRAAVTGDGPVDPRTAAVCGLISAMGWGWRVVPDVPKASAKARLTEIRRTVWAAEAVKRHIDDAAAVAAAVTAAAS